MVRILFVLSALAAAVLSAPAPQLGALGGVTGILGGLVPVGGLGKMLPGGSNNNGSPPKAAEAAPGEPISGATKGAEGSSAEGLKVPLEV